jgi:hypothetical protein
MQFHTGACVYLACLLLDVWPQDAPAQTAKALATANYDDPYYGALAMIIASGLAQGRGGESFVVGVLVDAYKQARRQCMQQLLVTWLAIDSTSAALPVSTWPTFIQPTSNIKQLCSPADDICVCFTLTRTRQMLPT